jgi:hypothetical protein
VFRRASKKRSSHRGSRYRKSTTVWFFRKWRMRWATCWMASATAQMPSYVYPWNLEYSAPRRESYSSRYSSAVWKKEMKLLSHLYYGRYSWEVCKKEINLLSRLYSGRYSLEVCKKEMKLLSRMYSGRYFLEVCKKETKLLSRMYSGWHFSEVYKKEIKLLSRLYFSRYSSEDYKKKWNFSAVCIPAGTS